MTNQEKSKRNITIGGKNNTVNIIESQSNGSKEFEALMQDNKEANRTIEAVLGVIQDIAKTALEIMKPGPVAPNPAPAPKRKKRR